MTGTNRPASQVIRDAAGADAAEILALNNAAVPAVTALQAGAFGRLADMAERVVVAEVDGQVGGFMVLLAGPGHPYESLNYRWFSDHYERFLYVDRIVVAPSQQGFGHGRRLYEWAIEFGSGSWPVLCAEVNTRPRNDQSLLFHERMGFVEVGTQDTEGGTKTVSLLARSLHVAEAGPAVDTTASE